MRRLAPILLVAFMAACNLDPDGPPGRPSSSPSASPTGPVFKAVSLGAKAAQAWPGLGNVETVTGIQMMDGGAGYAVGGPRLVLKTTDGGQSWTQVAGKAPEDNVTRLEAYSDLAFTDAQHGFVLAPAGCFRTQDGGATWSQVPEFKPGYTSLALLGPTDGFAAGPGRILRTTDGGATWQDDMKDVNGQPLDFDKLYDIGTIAGRPAFLGGKANAPVLMVRTGDGWKPLATPMGNGFAAFDFRDDQNGWLIGTGLHKTFDGGATWVQATVPLSNDAGTRVKLISDAEAWVVGRNGVAYTKTGGVRWSTAIPADPENPLHSVTQLGKTPVQHSGFQYRGPNDIWLANGSRALFHYTGN